LTWLSDLSDANNFISCPFRERSAIAVIQFDPSNHNDLILRTWLNLETESSHNLHLPSNHNVNWTTQIVWNNGRRFDNISIFIDHQPEFPDGRRGLMWFIRLAMQTIANDRKNCVIKVNAKLTRTSDPQLYRTETRIDHFMKVKLMKLMFDILAIQWNLFSSCQNIQEIRFIF
jgi:hypothetical protein